MDRKYTYLFRLLKDNEYMKAIKYISNCIERGIDDEIIYICYILLKIYELEIQNGIQNHIFSILELQDNLLEIKDFYQNIKFLIRRYEYNLDEDSKKQAIKYFEDIKISGVALYFITKYACVDIEKVLENLLVRCWKNNMYDIGEQIKSMI